MASVSEGLQLCSLTGDNTFGRCTENQVCGKDVGDNPNGNITSFDNLFQAMLVVFQSITLEGWVDVMSKERIYMVVYPTLQGGLHNHQNGALAAQLLEVNTPEFVEYSKAVVSNAGTLAEALIAKGHKLASVGTANHLVLWDLRPHGLTKSNVEKVCEACLDNDACISYDFVVGSQANSSFYSEATLLENRAAQTCDGHCGFIVKEECDLTFAGVFGILHAVFER